jgi:TonB family protein
MIDVNASERRKTLQRDRRLRCRCAALSSRAMRVLFCLCMLACSSGNRGPSAAPATPQTSQHEPAAAHQQAPDDSKDDESVTVLRSHKWSPYFGEVKAKISSQWQPKLDASDLQTRRVVVAIEILDDGAVGRMDVELSSGVQALDDEAIRSVKSAAPFAPPPAALRPLRFRFVFATGPDAQKPMVIHVR